MNDDVRDEEVLKLAFEEAQRGLTYQSKVHDSFISRAQGITALNAFFATFLGREALTTESPRFLFGMSQFEILAIFCLSASILLAIIVIRPSKGWIFINSPTVLISDYYEAGLSISQTRLFLSEHTFTNFKKNEKKLLLMNRYLVGSLLLSCLQGLFWLSDLKLYS
jgi:hypothetical protein